jgi:hypothetical protein
MGTYPNILYCAALLYKTQHSGYSYIKLAAVQFDFAVDASHNMYDVANQPSGS